MPENFPHLYKGTVRPWMPRSKTQNLWERVIFIGQNPDAKTYSRLVIRLKPATYDYDEPALFIQIGNGTGSTFVKTNLAEVEQIGTTITSWAQEVKPILAQAQQAATVLAAQKREWDKTAAMLRTLVPEEGQNERASYSDDIVEE